MEATTFEISGMANTLTVPTVVRAYINEQAESRTFSLDAFVVNKKTDPHQVVIVFNIVPTGSEQIEPFTTTLTLGPPAGKQLAQAISAALGKEVEG